MKSDMLFDVRGHVAVVTAGAGGLGFNMAEVMANNGAKVVILDVDTGIAIRKVGTGVGREHALGTVVARRG